MHPESAAPITLSLADRVVGDGAPTFVLAEVASAHQGDPDEAIALSQLASQAGADGIKFQLFRAADLIAPNDERYPTFEQIELSEGDWHRVLGHAEQLGLPLFADVFDAASLAIAEQHAFAAYKIHSTDLENPDLIRAVGATGKPILLGTGGVHPHALERAIAWVTEAAGSRWMPMHGVQNFPTRLEDTGLRELAVLRRRYGRPVGFLDHVDGGSAEAVHLPAQAVVAGADLVEKHITRDRAAEGFDYHSSLEAGAFASMIAAIRSAEIALGGEPSERAAATSGDAGDRYHRLMRRSTLAARSLEAGHTVTQQDVVFLRNETGLAPCEMGARFGARLRRPLAAYEPIGEEDLQ